MSTIKIGERVLGKDRYPLVIAEIGINHEGEVEKAIQMVDDVFDAGCECVKFQCHIVNDEMIPNNVVPGNADESIWEIIQRCSLTEKEEILVKNYVDKKGMLYLSTPFSRKAAQRLYSMRVEGFKIGSGECNNYPLIKYIAEFDKPVILSTGMNDISGVRLAVEILRSKQISFGLMLCTSLYPTPYKHVRLGGIQELIVEFPDAVVGISDHSIGIYTSLGAVACGASIVEKHFTSDKSWPGPDVPISIGPEELEQLVIGSRAVFEARGGEIGVLKEEQPTIDFAYACVVTTKFIGQGEQFSEENIWVKRPGGGSIEAIHYESILGRTCNTDVLSDTQLTWDMIK